MKPDFSDLGYFSGYVLSKTKSVTPYFFYLFGNSRLLPFCVASLKKSVRGNFWVRTSLSELSSIIFRSRVFIFHFSSLYREEIEAAQTLLFGLSAGAGVSALASSSLQTLSSTTPKSSGAQSSPSGMAPSTSQLNSKRAASESNSEGDSEEEDLGFGDSNYFHDNKYGEMRECLRSIQTSHFISYVV